jgi:hypothetical protein
LIQTAKQKEEEELAQCTFQPTIPKESEALAVKAFAEEYQQVLQGHDQTEHGPENGPVEGLAASVSAEGGDMRRIGSAERLVRRG